MIYHTGDRWKLTHEIHVVSIRASTIEYRPTDRTKRKLSFACKKSLPSFSKNFFFYKFSCAIRQQSKILLKNSNEKEKRERNYDDRQRSVWVPKCESNIFLCILERKCVWFHSKNVSTLCVYKTISRSWSWEKVKNWISVRVDSKISSLSQRKWNIRSQSRRCRWQQQQTAVTAQKRKQSTKSKWFHENYTTDEFFMNGNMLN